MIDYLKQLLVQVGASLVVMMLLMILIDNQFFIGYITGIACIVSGMVYREAKK
jgi:hypothetical protein